MEASKTRAYGQQILSWIECLLDSYQKAHGLIKPPISLDNLIKLTGTPFETIKLENCSRARIEKGNTGWVVVIPNHFSRARKRVELAHEIAHTFFFEIVDSSDSDSQHIPEKEELCEFAARHILMPEFLVRREIIINSSIAMQLLPVARKFDVTRHSIISRMLDEDLQDYGVIAVVIWEVSLHTETGLYEATPVWKTGPYYIPIKKCHARDESLTYNTIFSSPRKGQLEDVSIGDLTGKFISEACGYFWDTKMKAFKQVITVFRSPDIVNLNHLYKEPEPGLISKYFQQPA